MSELSERYGSRAWWLPDVPAFLEEVAARAALRVNLNLLVAVDLDRKVLGVKRLPARKAGYERRTRLAYDVIAPALEQMLPPRPPRSSPTGTGHLVRTRPGRVVPLAEDAEWERSLLYACGSICAYTGELVLVTPHGWRFADMAGHEPKLADLERRPRLRAVKAG